MGDLKENAINDLALDMAKLTLEPAVRPVLQVRTRRQALMASSVQPTASTKSPFKPPQGPVVQNIVKVNSLTQITGDENCPINNPVRRSNRVKKRRLFGDEYQSNTNEPITIKSKLLPTIQKIPQSNTEEPIRVKSKILPTIQKIPDSMDMEIEVCRSENQPGENSTIHIARQVSGILRTPPHHVEGKGYMCQRQIKKRVRFSPEVEVRFVEYDETRGSKEWHKNLTLEGRKLALQWRNEIAGLD